MLTIVMKTKNVAVLANYKALLVLRYAEKNLETIAKTIASATKSVEFFLQFV